MSVRLESYPGLLDALDDSDQFVNTGEEFTDGSERYVIVTQVGSKSAGGQVLFRIVDGTARLVAADTVVPSSTATLRRFRLYSVPAMPGCQTRIDADHGTVAAAMVREVNQFSSAEGPDGGNLACVWAVRHIVHDALSIWITRTDATAVFGQQLAACFGSARQPSDILAGGIIISPTGSGDGRARHGHVGLLGEGSGDDRLVYSNSSANKRWEQNWTVGSWRARYVDRLGLDLLFFPLPLPVV